MKIITNNILNRLLHYLEEVDNFVFLDTSKPDSLNSTSYLFVNPVNRLQFYQGQDESKFFNQIENLLKSGSYIAGWFSYEMGYLLEPSLRYRLDGSRDQGALLADLGVFTSYFFFDHQTAENTLPGRSVTPGKQQSYRVENLAPSITKEEYISGLERILAYIEAGDTYQVNYTLKLFFDFFGSPEQFYRDLRRNQSVSYGAYLRWNNYRIMSFSPELFFWKDHSSVTVRPMKGTMKRGRTTAEDLANSQFLQRDAKNQSENVMIVDLLRNDLGRLMHHANNGDVQVDSLFDVETFETLLQMTSTITGKTKSDGLKNLSLLDFFRAIFPCGSVTGAPKIRTMEIIDELECERRGVYTGAIGCMLPEKTIFNVPIRTLVLNGSHGEMGIGSGVVHDSEPDQEWRECLLKGQFLTSPRKDFQILETLLWTPENGYFLLERHLDRLVRSAGFFLFQVDRQSICDELGMRASEYGNEPHRIRLLLSKDGRYRIEPEMCTAPAITDISSIVFAEESATHSVSINKNRVESRSVWLFHKTTNRELYIREYAIARQKGHIDTLFENEEGHITEGCISNVIVKIHGKFFTPREEDGLLAGVMRQYLLDSADIPIEETSLTAEDLMNAEKVYICNSVRGIIAVNVAMSE